MENITCECGHTLDQHDIRMGCAPVGEYCTCMKTKSHVIADISTLRTTNQQLIDALELMCSKFPVKWHDESGRKGWKQKTIDEVEACRATLAKAKKSK